jgi:DNA helicase-2/ATP-dependent DNA helicase PcrA
MPIKISKLDCFQEFQTLDSIIIRRRLLKLYAFIICETHFEVEDIESYNNEVIRSYIDEGGDLESFFTSIKIDDDLISLYRENNIREISDIDIDEIGDVTTYTISGKSYKSKKNLISIIDSNIFYRNGLDNSMLSFLNNEIIKSEEKELLSKEIHLQSNVTISKKPIISHETFTELEEFKRLDDEQKDAVTNNSNNLVVLAGAGSGKTQTLALRYAYLHLVKGISIKKIAVLSFSNKASDTIKQRIETIIKKVYDQIGGMEYVFPPCYTIDKFFKIIIETEYVNFGFITKPKYEPNTDLNNLLVNILGKDENPELLNFKNIEGYLRRSNSNKRFDSDYERVIEALLDYQIQRNEIVGFLLAAAILRKSLVNKNDDTAKILTNYYEEILIDEAQDLDDLQFEIFTILNNSGIHFTYVGDDDQAIYGFRGANNQIIIDLTQNKSFKIIELRNNYRNNPYIVYAGNDILSKIKKRSKSENIIPKKTEGEKVRIAETDSELRLVAAEIKKLLRQGLKPKDISILYRSGNIKDKDTKLTLVTRLENALNEFRLPYVNKSDEFDFNNSSIYQTIKSLLFLETEQKSQKHIENIKLQGLLNEVIKSKDNKDNFKNIFQNTEKWYFKELLVKKINFSELLDSIVANIQNLNTGNLDTSLINKLKLYSEEVDLEYPFKANRLKEFFYNFENNIKKEIRKNQDAIEVNTIHSFKGLEFKVVFILELNQGDFPNSYLINRNYDEQLEKLNRIRQAPYERKSAVNRLMVSINEIIKNGNNSEFASVNSFYSFLENNKNEIYTGNIDGINLIIDEYEIIENELKTLQNIANKKKKEIAEIENENENISDRIFFENGPESNSSEKILIIEQLQALNLELSAIKTKINLYKQSATSITEIRLVARKILGLINKEKQIKDIDKYLQQLLEEKEREEEEAKRLFYVACTRAEQYLYLCHSSQKAHSHFIDYINPDNKVTYNLCSYQQEKQFQKIGENLIVQANEILTKEFVADQEEEIQSTIEIITNIEEKSKATIEEKIETHINENETFRQVRDSDELYYLKGLLKLYYVGQEYSDEVYYQLMPHQLQRLCETRLQGFSGKDKNMKPLNFHTDNQEHLLEIYQRLTKKLIDNRIQPDDFIFEKDLRTIFSRYSLTTKTRLFNNLRNLLVVHFVVRSGDFQFVKVNQLNWRTTHKINNVNSFFKIGFYLIKLRNNSVHSLPTEFEKINPNDLIKYAEQFLLSC